MSTLFLTGGTGFFGRALLRRWLDNAQAGVTIPQVTVLARSPDTFLSAYPEFQGHSWLHLHCGDINNLSTFPQDQVFTHVLHAAADSTLGPRLSPLQRYDQIVDGTRNLLNFAIGCGAQRFLLTSSGAVYGSQPDHLDRIPEDWHGMPDTLNSANAYGVGKRSAEHLCALYGTTYGLQTIVARCFAFIGPDLPLSVHFAIGNFVRDALWKDEIVVGGDGTPIRSYLDQTDLAHWLSTILEDGESGEAYNVGSDCAISVADLAHLVRDLIAPGKPVRIVGAHLGSPDRNIYVPDINKAKRGLALSVSLSLEDAVKATANAALNRSNQSA